jgi:hypothetical protein
MRPAPDEDSTATRSSAATPPRAPQRPLAREHPTLDRRLARVDPQQRLHDAGPGRDLCEPLVVGREHVRRANDAPPERRQIGAGSVARAYPCVAPMFGQTLASARAARDRALACARAADAAVGGEL